MLRTGKTLSHSFFRDKQLAKKNSRNRFSHYVMVPGCPRFPTLHPGVDDTINPHREMSFDHIELLNMGEATIKTLTNTVGKTCPKVLFLTLDEGDARYAPHLMRTYIPNISQEKQYDFTLHIAGHGDRVKIGSIDPDQRIPIDEFAQMLARLLETINHDNPIFVEFHTCNSAYCDIDHTMPKEQIKHLIRQETLIGKFIQEMRDEGFRNITATGYRGYYTHLASHQGSVVTDVLNNPTVTFVADKAAITVHSSGEVTLPEIEHALYFPVHLHPPATDRRALRPS